MSLIQGDGTVHLHTRTVRYGKLENGTLVVVRPSLIRRSKHHFLTLTDVNVDVVLGKNGSLFCDRSVGCKHPSVAHKPVFRMQHHHPNSHPPWLTRVILVHAFVGNNGYVWVSRSLAGSEAVEERYVWFRHRACNTGL
jgi:exosome complex RNA-binding protein Rrp4